MLECPIPIFLQRSGSADSSSKNVRLKAVSSLAAFRLRVVYYLSTELIYHHFMQENKLNSRLALIDKPGILKRCAICSDRSSRKRGYEKVQVLRHSLGHMLSRDECSLITGYIDTMTDHRSYIATSTIDDAVRSYNQVIVQQPEDTDVRHLCSKLYPSKNPDTSGSNLENRRFRYRIHARFLHENRREFVLVLLQPLAAKVFFT